MHFGVDYGSKLAGTTVITYDIDGILLQRSSMKKEDADAMVKKAVSELKPKTVYLDAPLSLPNAYFGKGEDYFYREADKILRAMSPMFLGGLTARAMKLKAYIQSLDVEVIETYPGALVRSIPELNEVYSKKDKTSIPEVLSQLKKLIGHIKIKERPTNLHQLDSIIAWYSGQRHKNGNAKIVGNEEEGFIIF